MFIVIELGILFCFIFFLGFRLIKKSLFKILLVFVVGEKRFLKGFTLLIKCFGLEWLYDIFFYKILIGSSYMVLLNYRGF